MRCFIGLSVTEDFHHAGDQLVKHYQSHPAMHDIRWYPHPLWHLTVRFLGATDEAQRNTLTTQLQKIAAQTQPFTLTTNGINIFPPRRPKVFCLSVRLNDALAELYRDINQATVDCGFAPEKRAFVPHITLGRWKTAPTQTIEKIPVPEVTQTVTGCHLYVSEPGEHVSVYTIVESFGFSDN